MYKNIIKNIEQGCNIDEKSAKKILGRFDTFGFLIALPINLVFVKVFNISIFILIAIVTTIFSIFLANKMSGNKEKIEKISKIMNIISICIACGWLLLFIVSVFL